jgi:hypothetical protein
MKELVEIQCKLKAPKSRRSLFGNYMFRSCEDILQAVKPILSKAECTLTISDNVIVVADRVYVEAIATITNSNGETVSSTAYAREPLAKKGFDETQLTGITSSYARKYALNGLLAIDDSVDVDAMQKESEASEEKSKETLARALAEIEKAKDVKVLSAIYKDYIGMMNEQDKQEATKSLTAKRKALEYDRA